MWGNSSLLLATSKNSSDVKPSLRCQATEHTLWCTLEICSTVMKGNVGSIALLLHVSFALMSLGKVPYVPCFGPAFLVAAEHFLPDWMMTCHLTIARKSLVGLIHMKEKMAYFAQLTESRISQETSYEKLMNLI